MQQRPFSFSLYSILLAFVKQNESRYRACGNLPFKRTTPGSVWIAG